MTSGYINLDGTYMMFLEIGKILSSSKKQGPSHILKAFLTPMLTTSKLSKCVCFHSYS
jgi:hypothetical protein